MKRLAFAFAWIVVLWTSALAAQETANPALKDLNLGATTDVLELQAYLKPFTPQGADAKEPGTWYTFAAVNLDTRPVNRVLQAGQLPSSGLKLLPRAQRPMILAVVSTSQGVVVESSNAYGRKGFRITVPPSSKVSVAVRLAGTPEQPSLLAWTEPGLAKHNKQIAIFVAAVAGLIGAAAAIAAGLAVMTHHGAPRWAAASLVALLLTRLSAAPISMFDGSIVTPVGGPYGLTALFAAMALVAGLRFVNLVVPLRDVLPKYARRLPQVEIGMLVVGGLAYIGIPGMTLLIDCALLVLPLTLFGYLVYLERRGSRAARILQPAAGLFAVASIAMGFAAMGGLGSNALVPDLAGGFEAAGAIMLALAVTVGEGITVFPWRHHPQMAAGPHPMAAQSMPVAPVAVPAIPHAAIEAIGASRQGVFELDLVNNFAILSPEAAALLGMDDGRLSHFRWIEHIHADDRAVYEQAIGEFRKQSDLAFRIEFRVQGSDGRFFWLELRATMKGPEGGAAERCVGLLADVTTRKEAEAEMMDRSLRDPLTGLGNRVALIEELENLGPQLNGVMIAVLDVDRFKAIHASLGDEGGDAVLAEIARRLDTEVAQSGQIFRTGGDSFAVLLPQPEGKPEDLGTALVKLCSPAHSVDDRAVFAPVSAGVALGRDARHSIDLLKNAELALLKAKREGGDCARLYAADMEPPADPVALEADLRRAIDAREIEVHYQPIIRLADRTIAGFEALLRWRHPTKGLVEPCDFIAHSEATGIIVALGRLALDRAAADLAEWQKYFPLPEPLFVSVNVSRRQMRDPELMHHLATLLKATAVAPGSFKVEMTESAISGDIDARDLATRIRALGAGLAIDDFGTGLSNLSSLADLPFDTIKIDKSFLSNGAADGSGDSGVVLASIVALAHDLKRAVVVEGVETEADAARMAELGAEFGQGYLFAGAMPRREAMTYIARAFRS